MAQGLIVVNTGILARVDNEAQLAAVLGHEMTHIINRHQIREYRALQNRQTAINVTAFLGTLALTAAAIDQSQRGRPEAAQAIRDNLSHSKPDCDPADCDHCGEPWKCLSAW